MKLCMSHYIHKSIPDAKFEADSSSSFGDMTSQNFPRKKGTSHQIRLFTPGKRVSRLKNGFLCPQNHIFSHHLSFYQPPYLTFKRWSLLLNVRSAMYILILPVGRFIGSRFDKSRWPIGKNEL